MTLVMSYAILLAATIAACGAALDALLARRLPRRWIWLSTLAATVVVTALVMVWPITVPDAGRNQIIEASTLVLSEPSSSAAAAGPPSSSIDVLDVADATLPIAWLLGSVALLLMIVVGQARLRRERSRARPTELAGHPALVSDAVGPAVAGLRSPVVFIPTWVLALDEPSQRLLMAHEVEHVRTRDTVVLFAGALAVAFVPWNPGVWWMVRRLRLAVEQDCDARVLAAHPGIRRYADLLLLAAGRHGLTTRLLAAHFGEHSSDLVRRIDAMTRQAAVSWRQLVPATAIASLLFAAACETPRPAPVAPIELPSAIVPASAQTGYAEIEKSQAAEEIFSVVVFSSDGRQLAQYAGEIPVAHLPKDGVQSVKAEEHRCGTSKCRSLRITLEPGYTLNLREMDELRDQLREMSKTLERYKSLRGGISGRASDSAVVDAKRKVGVPPSGAANGAASDVRVEESRTALGRPNTSNAPVASNGGDRDENLVLYHLHDPNDIGPVPPNVIVYNSDGSEHARFPSPSRPLASITLHGVESIKEQKTGDCAPLGCPMSRITLKPGFTLISYQEWKGRPQ